MLTVDASSQLLELVQQLVTATQATGYQLSTALLQAAWHLFISCTQDAKRLEALQQLAPEYGKAEFLLCVDQDGNPVPGDETLLRNFQETVAKHPDFDTWFRQVPMPNSDTSALLIARWLCHLGGFRHKTVHLFIDHPTLDNHTLIQVRGLNKAESPGCFDLPMAGHVVRLESVKDTLIKELGEELGLELEELEEITLLGSRGLISNPHPGFHNVEHHVVFRGRLSATGWQNVNANDHEVAAVAIFPLTDLQQMIVRFPNRVASGLKSSLALYTS